MFLNFAAKAKRRKCKEGYPCGRSCISRNYFCEKPLMGQGKSWADWLRKNGRIRKKSKKKKTAKRSSILERNLSEKERSNPKKLMKLGRAYLSKSDMKQIKEKIATYEKNKESYYDKERARLKKISSERDPLRGEKSILENKARYFFLAGKKESYSKVLEKLEEVQKELDNPRYSAKNTKFRYFNRYEELEREIKILPLNGDIRRTKKPKEEADKAIKERDELKAKLKAERDRELRKLPGYKELFNLLEQEAPD